MYNATPGGPGSRGAGGVGRHRRRGWLGPEGGARSPPPGGGSREGGGDRDDQQPATPSATVASTSGTPSAPSAPSAAPSAVAAPWDPATHSLAPVRDPRALMVALSALRAEAMNSRSTAALAELDAARFRGAGPGRGARRRPRRLRHVLAGRALRGHQCPHRHGWHADGDGGRGRRDGGIPGRGEDGGAAAGGGAGAADAVRAGVVGRALADRPGDGAPTALGLLRQHPAQRRLDGLVLVDEARLEQPLGQGPLAGQHLVGEPTRAPA